MRPQTLYVGLACSALVGFSILLSGSQQEKMSYRWVAANSMLQARSGACSALLPDGSVLISGGEGDTGPLATAEVFTPAGGVAPAAPMLSARSHHFCMSLNDGRVLVAGGESWNRAAVASAEIYDPQTRLWSQAGPMGIARSGATASLLGDGRVLIAGGKSDGTPAAGSLEIYDPEANAFRWVPDGMVSGRTEHAAAVLKDGRVVIAGGSDGRVALDTVDVFDPATGAVSALGRLSSPRAGLSATTLLDGRVYFAGGNNGEADLATTEIYNPVDNGLVEGAPMSVPRRGHMAVRIQDNNSILLAGGTTNGQPSTATELYIPWWNSYRQLPAPSTPAGEGTVTGLKFRGAVMMTSSESTSVNTATVPTVTADKEDYYPGDTVVITGANWPAGDTVRMVLHREPMTLPDTTLTSIVDASGSFVNDKYIVQSGDLGVTFYLTSTSSSGATAQTITFTDAPRIGSITVGVQSPNPVTAGSSATYTITVNRGSGGGSSGNFDANFSITTTLPSGVTASFSPGTLAFAPSDNSKTATLTLTTVGSTPAGMTSFTVRAVLPNQAADFAQANGTLAVQATCTSPSITTQPTTQSVTYGDNATFSAAADGSPTPSIQWQSSTDGGTAWTNIAGQTSTTLNIAKPSVAQSGYQYRAIFTNDCGGTKTAISNSATLTVNPRSLVVSAAGINRVYDGTTSATVTLSDNRVTGDVLTTAYASASFADKHVGTGKTVTVTGISISGADAGNYTFNTSATTTANITPRALVVSATGVHKVYDGTTAATVTLSDDRVAGDALTTDYTSASFGDKHVGTGKAVNVTGILISGADAGNYTFNTTASTTANITVRAITVTAVSDSRAYDGTTSSTGVPTVTAGSIAAGDTGNFTQTFDNKHVGTNKTLTPAGSVTDGNNGNNYLVTFNTASGSITARAITVTAVTETKVYDGTTSSSGTPTITVGTLANGDTATWTQAFENKNAGARNLIPAGTVNDGNGGNNYAVTFVSVGGTINQRALVVSAAGINRVYDGTTSATVTLSDNRVAGDVLTTAYTSANFVDKHVGTGKPVSVSGISISGADAGNYTFNTTASTTANITVRALVVSATGLDKVYDGTTDATVTLSDDRVAGDVLTTAYASASFANKHVGTGKPVNVTGISISGADAGNYTFNTTASTTANITVRAITVTAVSDSKAYDGTTSSTGVPTVTAGSIAAGDTGNFTQTFNNRNVGADKTLTPAGSVSDGNSGNNFAVTFNTASGSITARAITVTAVTETKAYDGTTSSSGTPTITVGTLANGDTATWTQAFDSKNAGARNLIPAGTVNDGNGGNNYAVTLGSVGGTINQRALVVSAAGINKVYDGTTSATVTLSDNRVTGDVLTTAYASASFADKTVGMSKPVSVSGISISGADAGNYTFNTSASTTANITPRALVVSATGVHKVYDGTIAATITLSDDRVAGDVLTTAYTSASFGDKHVGTGKPVNVTGISISGADAGNYTFNTTASITANITARSITVTAASDSKEYDGTTNSTGVPTVTAGSIAAGDTGNFTQTFNNKHVGVNKPLTPAGSVSDGNSGNNYAVTFNTASGSITARAITVTAVTETKTYDGTTSSSGTPTITVGTLANGDTATWTQAFDSKNAGARNLIPAGTVNDGNGGNNYAVTLGSVGGTINQRALVVSAAGINKVYDGTTSVTVTLSDNRVTGDVLTTAYASANFVDKHVGTGKPVSVSGISISGADAGNYTFNTSATTTANITPRALVVSATGVHKVYDGTIAATITLSDDRVAGDVLTTAYTSASFGDKHVGTGKPVNVTGISISGADAGNYTFNTTASTTANITARSITVTAASDSKEYDGTTSSTGVPTMTLGSLAAGDAASFTQVFNNKNVGANKTLTPVGSVNDGNSGNNYLVTFNTATGSISARAITVKAVTDTKIYDGTTSSSGTPTMTVGTLANGDTAIWTQAFDNKNAGARTLIPAGMVNDSNSGNNYAVTFITVSGAITQKALIISANDKTRLFNSLNPAFDATFNSFVNGEGLGNLSGILSCTTSATISSPAGTYPINCSGLSSTNYSIQHVAGVLTVVDMSVPITSGVVANPVPLNTIAVVTAKIDDSLTGASFISAAEYQLDNGAPVPMSPVVGAFNKSAVETVTGSIPPFSATGVHSLCVRGADSAGNVSAWECALLAAYDPNAGFVTGGGWINSPTGASTQFPDAVGKANFGFVAKYKKGQSTPEGQTQFDFHAGNLKFHSESYAWLVVAGSKAQFKGSGQINGTGTYEFLITAIDGDTGTKKPDAFRIKITNTSDGTTVYDNQMGKDETGDFATTLGGGSIHIQAK